MSHDARVLVVDDSAAMRALFCEILDEAKNVRVVGAAASADEARDSIAELRPNVLTLDVEMPGTSGLQFLEEIMETDPLPVVMLSSLTQSGADTSLKAFELGAVECFAKPTRTTPEEFGKTVAKLGKIVHAAANSNVRKPRREAGGAGPAAGAFSWNGTILAFSTSMGGIDALGEIIGELPADCPPTIILLQAEPTLARSAFERVSQGAACNFQLARDKAPLEQGTAYLAFAPDAHVVVEKGEPALLRLVDRDAVNGCKPSADVLYASLARSGASATGAVLTGMGVDGARGLAMMKQAGAYTLAEDPEQATVGETPRAAIAQDAAARILPLDGLVAAAIDSCRRK